MSGVSASFDNEIHRTVSAIDADAWLVPADSFGPFTGPATMPAARAAAARRLPGVRRADPIAVLGATTPTPERGSVNLLGVVPGGVGSPRGAQARRSSGPVPPSRMRALASSVGDRLDLNGSDFRVGSGHARHDLLRRSPRVTVSLHEAQRLALDGQPLATAIVTEGRPTAHGRGFTSSTTPT